MKYQIHKNIVISNEKDQTLVMVSRTETFIGTDKELRDHLRMFSYHCDQVIENEFAKLNPKPPDTIKQSSEEVKLDDEIPF